ncbi:MAG: OmpA family protein [FCB group bacterium]|jgi:outer membrane protein OmpA-like peptidoglycan-associated protein
MIYMRAFKKIITYVFLITIFTSVSSRILSAQLVNAVVAVTGNIFDAVTKEPVTALLVITDENGKKVNQTRSNSAENGAYYIPSLSPGKKYFITLNKPNYFTEKYEIVLANTDKYDEISRDFLIKPKDKGVKIPLPVPPFELNQTKLRYGAEDLLEGYTNTLINNPEVKFQIQCYPDNNNDQQKNKSISEDRCKSILNYFVSKGIDASRISIEGSQSTDPKNPPPTQKMAKGKRYIGPTYLVVTDF